MIKLVKTMYLHGSFQVYIYLLHSLVHWPPRKKALLKILDQIFMQFPDKKFRIVDIGSGPGLLARAIQDRGADYLGIDNDPETIKYCNKLFDNRSGFTFSDINVTDSTFQFDKNDIIILSGVAHHLNDIVLSKLLEKASKGFALIISDHASKTSMDKNQLLPAFLQRLDRGKFIRPYKYFKTLEGYTLHHSEKFPIKIAGITFWAYFCNVYQPE